jgi:hypothetical protein
MNTPMKNTLLAVIMTLLFSACGPMETALVSAETPEPIVAVTETPADVASAVTTEAPALENVDKYIGLNYPPIPNGLTEVFAMLIQDSEDHSFSLILEDQNEMLWLSQMTHLDSSGNAYWEVKDILDLSDQESGVALLPDGCSLNGEPDYEILVIGRDGAILQAWRADTTLDVFEVIPVDGIECQSDKAWSFP